MEATLGGTRVAKPTFRINKEKMDRIQEEWGNPGETLDAMEDRDQVVLPLHDKKNERYPRRELLKYYEIKQQSHVLLFLWL